MSATFVSASKADRLSSVGSQESIVGCHLEK